MIEQVIYGILSGVVYSIAGWQKNYSIRKRKFDKVELNWWELGKTTLICTIVGGFAGYSGQDFNVLIVGGLGIGATKVISLVWNFVKSKF